MSAPGDDGKWAKQWALRLPKKPGDHWTARLLDRPGMVIAVPLIAAVVVGLAVLGLSLWSRVLSGW